MVKIIGISGVGGAGKSLLTEALAKRLNATSLKTSNTHHSVLYLIQIKLASRVLI